MVIKSLPTDRDGKRHQILNGDFKIEVFISATTLIKLSKIPDEIIFSKLYDLAKEKGCNKIDVVSDFIYDATAQKLTKIGLTDSLIS